MLSLPSLLAKPTAVPLVVLSMFDSETVAFVSGECDASSMKVAFFHRSSPAPAASCAEIVAFVTCFRRVTIDLAGICKGKRENRNVLPCAQNKTMKLF